MIHYINKNCIHIGAGSGINSEGHLTAHKDAHIYIGKDCNIGPYVVMNTGDHKYRDKSTPIKKQGHVIESIIIGDDVWIGAHVTILRGSFVPQGCVIGACSLVTRHDKLEPYCAYAGNPVRKIGERS